jgi:hypothetical protein
VVRRGASELAALTLAYMTGRGYGKPMRESKKSEKTHLPRNTYEVWLESQSPKTGEVRHKSPPTDTFEAWMEKRVGKRLRAAPARGRRVSKAKA